LHQWYKKQVECDYPAPMVNHDEESRLAKQRFKQAMLSFSAGSQTT
jgi:deoxyribodipyrimidine photolyase